MEEVLVDGSNLLLNLPQFSGLTPKSPVQARDKLLRKLEKYRKASGREVTVIFDVSLAPSQRLKKAKSSRLRVIFTKQGQDTDSAIKNLVKQKRREVSVGVVTMDQNLGRAIRRLGGKYLSNFDFLEPTPQTKKARAGKSLKTRRGVSIAKSLDPESLTALRKFKATLKKRSKAKG